jgi:hypothetical protein
MTKTTKKFKIYHRRDQTI